MGDWGGNAVSIMPTGVWCGPVVTSGTANVKGNWLEAFASLPYDSILETRSIMLNGSYQYLFDIGIGSAGNEIVIIENLHIDWPAAATYGYTNNAVWPVKIPAGSRVSVRVQSTQGSAQNQYIWVQAIPIGGFESITAHSICLTLGANAATSNGTSIDPGAVADTYSAWTVFSASTSIPIRAILFHYGSRGYATRNASQFFSCIGVGAESSEIIVIEVIEGWCHGTTKNIGPLYSYPYPVDIPAGSRLSVKMKSNVNTALHRVADIILYCFG